MDPLAEYKEIQRRRFESEKRRRLEEECDSGKRHRIDTPAENKSATVAIDKKSRQVSANEVSNMDMKNNSEQTTSEPDSQQPIKLLTWWVAIIICTIKQIISLAQEFGRTGWTGIENKDLQCNRTCQKRKVWCDIFPRGYYRIGGAYQTKSFKYLQHIRPGQKTSLLLPDFVAQNAFYAKWITWWLAKCWWSFLFNELSDPKVHTVWFQTSQMMRHALVMKVTPVEHKLNQVRKNKNTLTNLILTTLFWQIILITTHLESCKELWVQLFKILFAFDKVVLWFRSAEERVNQLKCCLNILQRYKQIRNKS